LYKDTSFGDVDMTRLSVFMNNIHNGNYSLYITD
jgi:hypothetical protein